MSQQMLETLMFLDSQTIDDVGESFIDGISSVLGQIECSDAEKVVLTSLAIACTKPNMQYSAELACAIKGRELAAVAVIEILRKITKDVECDQLSQVMAYALACELAGVVKIVDALEIDPMHWTRTLLDGPYQP